MRARLAAPDPAATGAGPAAGLSAEAAGSAAIASTLAAFAVRFEVALGRCRGADDDNALHDARVAARRLEAALRVWRDALAPRACRAARKRLARWRRRLAAARDLEVFADALANPDLAPFAHEAAAIERLRASIEQRRDRARRRIAGRLTPHRCEKLRAWLGRIGTGVTPGPDALQSAMRRCARADRAAERALAAAAHTEDDHALHEARLAVKRKRYADDALAAAIGLPPTAASASARALQRALGAVHDLAVVRDRLRRRARKQPDQQPALESVAARVESLRRDALARFRSLQPPAPAAG